MIVSLYVIWVLFAIVAFVSHLGQDAYAVGLSKSFQRYVPAGANPTGKNLNASSVADYFYKNLPNAIIFIV
jgi:hypothetical protein